MCSNPPPNNRVVDSQRTMPYRFKALLFTLMLHLLFSPGRTLFGTCWLSYDGLLTGLRVAMELLLALFFAVAASFWGIGIVAALT